MTRPTQIQKLIEWLREPGCNLISGDFFRGDGCCTMGKLALLCDAAMPDVGIVMFDKLEARLGRKLDADWCVRLYDFSDKHSRDPLAVADYLEQQFPVTE